MLTGSTSGLRSFLALSSQLSCPLWRHSALFARGHSIAPALLPRNRRISSTSYHRKTVLKERDGPRSLATNAYQDLGVRPPVVVNGTPRLDMRTPPADKDGAGIDFFPVTQDYEQHERLPRIQRPHRVPVHTKRKCPAQRRRTLLWVMLTAKSPDRAWAAYQELQLLSHRLVIPPHLLHRLVRLLASIKPRTRTVYLQLLSALKALQKNRGILRLWEWNTLIDCTGKQWHKTRLEDYENSLDIFNKKGVLPAGNATSADECLDSAVDTSLTQQDPDICTYNILLSVASRTTLPLTIRHASSLLHASGLTPNRYTHLCLLRYFSVRNDLRSVRSTLRKMQEQDLEVGLDGINACLWAYARNGRFDVAMRVYRVLRSNVDPTPNLGDHDIDDDSHYIRDTVGLANLDRFEPDEATYTLMIQALAYHGDLRSALGVFVDMLSTRSREAGACMEGLSVNPVYYKPSMAAFRGLFLGFARHGRDTEYRTAEAEPVVVLFPSSQAAWDLDTLETIFTAFLRLPSLPKPTDRVVYWILVAFDKTSGNDVVKLRDVWAKLEAKYGGNWGGRLGEIRRSVFTSNDGRSI